MMVYCKTLYFRCILISRFWNVEISLHFNLAFSQCSISIYQAFEGKLNFHGYLISRFYPTPEIRKNLMHAKNMFYSIRNFCYVFIKVVTQTFPQQSLKIFDTASITEKFVTSYESFLWYSHVHKNSYFLISTNSSFSELCRYKIQHVCHFWILVE